MEAIAAYLSLFATAFLAATLIPAQSELLFAGLFLSGRYEPLLLISVATAGNTMGSCVNWLLGRYLETFKDRRWFPVSPANLATAERWYRKWGIWSLLLSWAPLFGDALTMVAGVLKVRLAPFLILVLIAKGGRYVLLAYGLAIASAA